MSVLQPFNPKYGSGQTVAPAAASASVVVGKGEKSIRFVNTGASPCYVRLGANGVAASAADFLIPAAGVEVLTKDQDHDTVAHISAAGTTLNIILGEGW